MKLSGRSAARHFAKPDPSSTGTLIYGQDAMRVALKRQELISGIIGPKGEEEMRFERIPATSLRREPALLGDMVKAQGFFPGPRAVLVEDAGDGLAKTIEAALGAWKPGDAQIVATAGALSTRSALRKAFEAHKTAFAVGIYNDPPGPDEIQAELERASLHSVDREAMTALASLAYRIDPGDLRQTIDKLALYKLNDGSSVVPADVEACAPATVEAAVDDLLHVVAEARTAEIGSLVRMLGGQGVAPVTLCIGATRHFRALHMATCDPGGPGSGIAKLRPPVYGPRRDRMLKQARGWGLDRLERALGMLTDTDLQLRAPNQTAPQMAVMERTLIRLSMLASARL